MNEYYCKNCGSPATKPALVAAPLDERPANGSLGTWHCKKCKTKVKVIRTKRSPVTATE